MTQKIQDLTKTTTFIETSDRLSGEPLPRIMFEVDSFDFDSKPVWITNRAIQREGNFQHYMGSDDAEGEANIILFGATKENNLAVIKAIKEPIYLDVDDLDPNLSGNYVLLMGRPEYNFNMDFIRIPLRFIAYNN